MRATLTRLSAEVRLALQNFLAFTSLVMLAATLVGVLCVPLAAQGPPAICGPNTLPNGDAHNPPDLVVIGDCHVKAGTYWFGNVNIVETKTGKIGRLIFDDPAPAATDFWAQSILVQNKASLLAGTDGAAKPKITPIVGTVTIHLWGKDQLDPTTKKPNNTGIQCVKVDDSGTMPAVTPDQYCGVDPSVWGRNKHDGSACTTDTLPGNVTDCFYSYMPIDYDNNPATQYAYFGSKVLGVSYGGTLQLYGKRGVASPEPTNIASSGTSWARLSNPTGNVAPGTTTITLDRAVAWKVNDWIVVSSTDYLPGHAEQMQIDKVDAAAGATILTVHALGSTSAAPKGFAYPHNGALYPYRGQDKIDPSRTDVGPVDDPNLPAALKGNIETRAAVGLLTRSIRIVSEGDTAVLADKETTTFPKLPSSYSYGGHTMFRQGFESVQVQGVEFYQMGQGGRIMHYPVHFHMARKVPANTFIKDSSIWDSMTRWITIHASQGVLLQRNVGYLSIGHGFYLEDGTETDNKLYANLGVFARAAVKNAQNPRSVPGILAANRDTGRIQPASPDGKTGPTEIYDLADSVPYYTDIDHPSVFWIMNGWNDFEYNQASGAGSCGVCYWLVPGANSTMSQNENWTGYASAQSDFTQAGKTPLQRFVGNACSSAQSSFLTIGNTSRCDGVYSLTNKNSLPPYGLPTNLPLLEPINNLLAPQPPPDPTKQPPNDPYYPIVDNSSGREATLCPDPKGDCGKNIVEKCGYPNVAECTVTVIDHYTTMFNWAEVNYSAMWLRPQWYLVSNSAMTDVQNGGLTFVSGGGYSYSDEIPGYWALAYRNVFVGTAQKGNDYANPAGPYNMMTFKGPDKAQCDLQKGTEDTHFGGYCMNNAQGVSFPLRAFSLNQRFFNIYDGPSYEDSDAYLNIHPSTLTGCKVNDGAACANLGWMYGGLVNGVLADQNPGVTDPCYLPHAAIGWKQPNGFYYPPAFHSTNLFFGDVDIRHFVVEPLFTTGTYTAPDATVFSARYCTYATDMFTPAFTDVDRQTELSDDDGTLTGLVATGSTHKTEQTISVNQDKFFTAPLASLDTRECSTDIQTFPSNPIDLLNAGTALTSPYDYLTTVIYPDCGDKCTDNNPDSPDETYFWSRDCKTQQCFGVPLYRRLLTPDDSKNPLPFIRMAGQGIGQRSTLTVDRGVYYVDTSATVATQGNFPGPLAQPPYTTEFRGGHTYYLFNLYAKPTTKQTYQIWVEDPDGKFEASDDTYVWMTRVKQGELPGMLPNGAVNTWPTSWTRAYDPASHILTVTMDMNGFSEFSANYTLAANNRCAPLNFCTGGSSCACNTKVVPTTDPYYKECEYACSKWATKDVNCPQDGCYAVAIKMPPKFKADDMGGPKAPSSTCNIKSTDTDWQATFTAADSTKAGQCAYSQIPKPKYCP